jgi:hypothetical protein
MRVGECCYYVYNGHIRYGKIIEMDTYNCYFGGSYIRIPQTEVFKTRGEAQSCIDSSSKWWYNLWKKIVS